MCIIDELSEMRKRWNLTQYDLSQILGTTRDYIKDMETKQREPSFEMLMKWSNALGCNIKLEFRK